MFSVKVGNVLKNLFKNFLFFFPQNCEHLQLLFYGTSQGYRSSCKILSEHNASLKGLINHIHVVSFQVYDDKFHPGEISFWVISLSQRLYCVAEMSAVKSDLDLRS